MSHPSMMMDVSHHLDSASNSPSMHGLPQSNSGGGPASMQLSNEEKESREQDRLLPIANISRIMKKVLPDHAKMSKEAKSAVQECVSEFIGFITSEASDRLMDEKRKTITGDDIIDSMRALGFDSYMEFLVSYLKKYRQSTKQTKGASNAGGGGGAEKPVAPGAHKRGRKARGGDDDDDDHSTSPLNVPSDHHPSYSSGPASMFSPTAAAAQQQQQMMQMQMQQQMGQHQLTSPSAADHVPKRKKV